MTDKVQLIREEIERQIEKAKVKCQQSQENNDHESFVAWSEHVATCGKLLVFINSLPEEPASNDLEEEIDKIWKTCNPIDEGMGVETANIHIEQFDYIVKYFAEWQKQKLMQDFLEKADKFFKNELYVSVSDQICSINEFKTMEDFVNYFKNYMKNEM